MRFLSLACAMPLLACSEIPPDPADVTRVVVTASGEHVLSADPETHLLRERLRASAEPVAAADPADELFERLKGAPLVVLAKPISTRLELRQVSDDEGTDERAFVVAKIDVVRTLLGTPSADAWTVEMVRQSGRPALTAGTPLLLALKPDPAGRPARVIEAVPVVGDLVPAFGRGLDALAHDLQEVRHAP